MSRRKRTGNDVAPEMRGTAPRAMVNVTMEPELFKLFADYHNAVIANFGLRLPADTIRELLWKALTGDDRLAVIRAQRASISRNMDAWLFRRMALAVGQIKKELDQQIALQIAELQASGEDTSHLEEEIDETIKG